MPKLSAAIALIAACAAASAASPERVGYAGLGKARIGLSEPALAKSLGVPLVHADPRTEEAGCFYASAPGVPVGVGLMILNGHLARIDISEPGIPTISGAQVGMAEPALKRLYGTRLVQQPHAYTGPEGHYLTLRSPDGRYGVRFETDGKVVTGYYAGTAEAIQYIEGCQ